MPLVVCSAPAAQVRGAGQAWRRWSAGFLILTEGLTALGVISAVDLGGIFWSAAHHRALHAAAPPQDMPVGGGSG